MKTLLLEDSRLKMVYGDTFQTHKHSHLHFHLQINLHVHNHHPHHPNHIHPTLLLLTPYLTLSLVLSTKIRENQSTCEKKVYDEHFANCQYNPIKQFPQHSLVKLHINYLAITVLHFGHSEWRKSIFFH